VLAAARIEQRTGGVRFGLRRRTASWRQARFTLPQPYKRCIIHVVSDSAPSGVEAPAWLVRGGEEGEREQRALAEGLTFIGWPELGDISGYDTRDGIRLALKAAYPDYADNVIANWTGQLWRFTNQIAVGDYVVMPLHTKPGHVAIGRVTGSTSTERRNLLNFAISGPSSGRGKTFPARPSVPTCAPASPPCSRYAG